MKYIIHLAYAALLTLLATQAAQAQSSDIASNQVALTLDEGGAWTSGTTPASTELATWSGTYTAANCTNDLAASATWGGIDIGSVTGAPIDIKTANGSILTLEGLADGASLDTIDLSAATVDLTVGCEIYVGGGATNSFTVASGRTFTYNSSSALFFSFATGSTPAVLSLNGAGNYVFNGPLDTYVRLSGESNWPIFEMNGTGECSLNSSGHAMNFALNSGTLNINNIYAISGYSGQTLTINGGTIDNTSGSEINIGNSDNNPVYDWDGDFAYGGSGALDLGPGAVTLGQNVQLTCNGSSTLTVEGAIGDGGSGYSLTKAGSGTLLLTGSSTYGGATVINAGTLALGSGASLAAGSSISIAAGATLDASADSSYSLGSDAGLSASGTGTGSSTAAAINGSSDGTISLGSRPITLTYNGSQPALYISQGTLVLDGNAFTVNGSALSAGNYTLIEQASGNISSSGSYSVSGTALGSGSGTISVSGGNVVLTVSSSKQSTTTTLNRTTGSSSQTYGSALVFTATVEGQTTSPSGSVVFEDGSTPLFTNTLTAGTSPDSSATYTSYTALGVNGGMAHSIAAYYQGDSTHNSSSSSTISQTIAAKSLTVTGLTADNKTYDGTTTATLSGAAALLTPETPGSGMTSDGIPYTGDTVSVAGTPTGTFASPNVGNNISVSVTGLSLTGAQSGDYSFTEPTLSADITSPMANDIASNQVALTLDQGGAWISGTAPTATNLATWSGTYTAANCTNDLAASATWGGIDIGSVTGAPIDIKTANGSILTLEGLADGASLDTIDLSAATVDLTVGCEIYVGGGATNSFTVASGRTFTYNSSSALFFSFATGSTPAVLSLNGAGNYVFNGPLDTYVRLSGESNWPIFEMNGTGECSLNSSGHAMNFALNSGTLNINNIYAISGYSGQTLTINGGTIDNTSGSEINIGNSDNNPVYDWDGDFAYGGSGALDLGPGAVTLGQNVQLTCNGSSTLTVEGAIGDGGSGYSLTKAGSGTLLLTGSSTYGGATVINAGTLALGSGASLAAGSSISIAAGATLDASADSSYSLGSDAGLSASGTGTGSSTAAAINGSSDGTISLGSRPITLTYNGSQPALYISQGTLVLDGNAFTVNGSALSAGNYTLIEQASGNISSSGSYSVSGTALGSGSGTISVSGGNLVLTITGSGGSQSTTTTLNRTTGSSPQTYGSALVFTATVEGQTTSPSGSVVFEDGSTPLFTNTLTAGTSPDSSATYTSYTALGVNGGMAHSIAAYYQGDSTHNSSSSSGSPISQTVTTKALTVTGLTADNKIYDGTTTATLSGAAALLTPETPGSGMTSDGIPYTGDTVSVAGTPTGTFASPNVGNNISVSVTGLSLTGAQSGDYSFTEPALSADITSPVVGDIASNQVAVTLDEGGAWISGTAPTATNLATWSGTYTAANCTNDLAASATWGGIDIGSVTGAPIDIKTANGSILTLEGLADGASLDTIDLSAATVDLTVGCEIYVGGGATNSFTVASGRTFTYNSSSALFFSFATGSTPAVLSLNGAGNYVFNGPLDTYVRLSGESNWPIFEMNGTGECSLNSSGHAMNFALNSGTLNINNIYAISGYSGQTLTINGGTIDNTSGSEINIGNSDNNPVYDWDGDFAYGGSGALDLGPGAVTLGQNVQLTCNGSSTLTVEGAIGDGGSGYSLTKAGSGTLLLTGSSTYSGATVINAGTLALGSGASLAAGSSISIAAGATLDVSADSSYSLGSDAGLSASGTGTGSSTAAAINGSSDGTISLGSRPITLTYNGSQPALYISQGTLVLDGNAFTVNGSALSAGNYTLIEQASGNISSSGSYSVSGTALGSGSGTISVSGGNLVLTITGSGGSQSTTTTLNRTTGSSPQTYGSALVFTATVEGQTTSPSGSVVFEDGSTPLFTNTLTAGTSPDSSATYTSYTALGVNGGMAHSIAAYYQGDSTHNSSSSSGSPISQTVTTKALTVTGLTADNKIYDGTTTATLSGAAALLTPETPGSGMTSDGIPYTGDTVSVAGTPTGTFASPNVGNNISVSVTGLSLTGAQSGDYSLTEPALSADITGTNTNTNASVSLWLTSSSQTNAYQIPVAFGATVLTNGGVAVNATGNVTFLTNGVVFYTTNLVNGTADSPYIADLPLGVSTITAEYTGGNYPGMTNTMEQVLMQQTSNITFSNSLIEFTFTPEAAISTITNVETGDNRNYNSQGFYLWNQQYIATGQNHQINFSSMVEIASNVVLLSTADGHYNVTFQVTCQPTYLKFSLLNVSDCPSGGIDTNWIGWSVAFSCYAFPYVNDGWQIYCLGLDPMEDVLSTDNPIEALWPYVQFSQPNAYGYPYINQPNSANTNGFPLQPMGALAVYGCTTAAEHDSILYDIWGAESSLPEPNRSNLTNAWNRAAAEAWVTNWLTSLPPTKLLFLAPNSLADLYSAADIMYAKGLNGLYLFNYYWQGDSVDAINTNLFPNGLSDVTTFEQYCAARGISLYFHSSSAWVSFDDPTYGAMSPTGLSSGLSRWATGTLLTDINSNSTSFNVRPDPGYQIVVDPPPWGDYDLESAITLADDYPPYYPNWLVPMLNINNDLMFESSVTQVNPTNWLVSGITRTSPNGTPVGQFGSYWGERHTAGDHVDFIVSAYGSNFIPDSRSEVLTNLAVRYATLLNEENIAEANYDALEQQQDLGNWGPRRFSQAVYEALNHPVHANSSFGTAPWGHFEYNFDSVQQHDGGPGFQVESSEAAPAAQVRLWDPSLMATHLDEDQFCFGLQASYCPNMAIGGYHVGTTVNTITNQGSWSEVVSNLNLWQSLAPYLTTNEQAALRSFGPDFYVPSQSGSGWDLTPTRAMLRDGIDAPWQLMTESGPISPHQFMQVGDTLNSLTNPYTAQTPQIEMLVLPSMTATNSDNVSLLPSGSVTFTSQIPYNWNYTQIPGDSAPINMSQARGIAITVTGDGSGSDLVLNIGGRYYVVTVNFTGTQTIEIPNGEVEMYRSSATGYSWINSGQIGTFNYGAVGSFSLFLGYVPSEVNPNITVSSITTMQEDQTIGLVNPTLTLNGASVSISGTISYNDYVVYSGGSTASEYDPNWNFVKTLPVSGSTLTADTGLNSFSVVAPDSPNTWLAVRVKVSGTSWTISP